MPLRSKSYVLIGHPIAWQRVHFNSNNVHFYDGQIKDKVNIGIELGNQHGDEPLFDRPISFDVVFYMRIPSKYVRKKPPTYHTNCPDTDNLIKFLLDVSQDVLFTNDKIVCCLSAKKLYASSSRTEFTITELE